MSITPDRILRRDLPSPSQPGSPPPGPFLCTASEPIPPGWERTEPSAGTSTCMAFDPRRHTVVASLNTRYDSKLVEAVGLAGFDRFQVPGTDTGFFARDRSIAPPATLRRPDQGLDR